MATLRGNGSLTKRGKSTANGVEQRSTNTLIALYNRSTRNERYDSVYCEIYSRFFRRVYGGSEELRRGLGFRGRRE